MRKTVRIRESYEVLNRRRKALLKKIATIEPFIMATPAEIFIKCGNPNCKCAKNKKDRHEKYHISWTDSKGSSSCYVPINLRGEVKEWIENYWILKSYMQEMTLLSRKMIRVYAKSHPRAKKRSRT